MQVKTLSEIPELKDKRVLLRVDFNVPIKENGKIQDDTRIVEAIPTINYLRLKGARLIIMSHLGRPDGQIKENLRLTEIAAHLSKLLEIPVKKIDDIIGPKVATEIASMQAGDVLMLENIRFDAGEEKCDPEFTKKLATLGDIFVNDAFGTAHRRHASTAGLADHLPAYSGLLIEKEIKALSPIVEGNYERPLTMIFGGAKIDTKIGLIKNFTNKADYFLVGGGLANTFLSAAGYQVGQSLHEKEKEEIAREIMLKCEKEEEKFILPHDVVVASEVSEEAETANVGIQDILGDMKIFDIGKWSTEKFCNILEKSKTVIWNGPLGLYEYEPFRSGSAKVAAFLAKHDAKTVIGGGDTTDLIKRLNIPVESFYHVSTGGGACIEFLEGKTLPGIEVLLKSA